MILCSAPVSRLTTPWPRLVIYLSSDLRRVIKTAVACLSSLTSQPTNPANKSEKLVGDELIVSKPGLGTFIIHHSHRAGHCSPVLSWSIYRVDWMWPAGAKGQPLQLCSAVIIVDFWHRSGLSSLSLSRSPLSARNIFIWDFSHIFSYQSRSCKLAGHEPIKIILSQQSFKTRAVGQHPWGREFKDLYCFSACKINCSPSWGVKTLVAIQVGCRDTRQASHHYTVLQTTPYHNQNIFSFIKIFQSCRTPNISLIIFVSRRPQEVGDLAASLISAGCVFSW